MTHEIDKEELRRLLGEATKDTFAAGLNIMTEEGITARCEGAPFRGKWPPTKEGLANTKLYALAPALAQAYLDLLGRVYELENTIDDIREFAHYQSTGPAVPDGYWSIRDMASRVDEDSKQTRERIKQEVLSEIAFKNALNGIHPLPAPTDED